MLSIISKPPNYWLQYTRHSPKSDQWINQYLFLLWNGADLSVSFKLTRNPNLQFMQYNPAECTIQGQCEMGFTQKS